MTTNVTQHGRAYQQAESIVSGWQADFHTQLSPEDSDYLRSRLMQDRTAVYRVCAEVRRNEHPLLALVAVLKTTDHPL